MKSKQNCGELEQKISELELEIRKLGSTENQYRSLVDSTSDSLYLVDDKGRYIFMNKNHIARVKLPVENIINHQYSEFHNSEQSEDFNRKIKAVIATGQSLQDEHQSSQKGGYFLRSYSPVYESGENSPITAVAIVSKDITERRRIEEELKNSEEKHRLLIENSTEAIIIIKDSFITFANRRTTQLLGINQDEIKTVSLKDMVIEEDRNMFLNRQQSTLAGEIFHNSYSFRIINGEGKTIWVETNGVSIQWDNKPATLNFMRDITRQRKTEARLFQAQKMESIGTLAGGIAHDFNNLLMGIQGHASLALLRLDSSDPNYEHLKTIETLVMNGADLTKQLLGFARGGKYEVNTLDINSLIHKTSETIGRTKKEIRIHRKLADNLWPVDADQKQLEQVLLNLFVNAWQAMPGGGDLYLETSNFVLDESRTKPYDIKNGQYVKISVTDTGIGMDEKTCERIFEPFFTTKGMGRGTGLGLASAYGIIKNHNGFINVYSEKGQGTTFNIYLPFSARRGSNGRNGNLNHIIKGNETILLIDDESLILNVGREMLHTLGYTVITAPSGLSALNIYRQHNKREISLVILDMVMPEMSGSEVFDELKKIDPDVKVLLSSGYSLNGHASKIIERGCVGFIQKPFSLHDISSRLRGILDKRQ